jgi:hypothetical protein
MKASIKLFEEKKVRALWNETEDGKMRLTYVANTEQLFATIKLSPERALSNSVWQRHTVNWKWLKNKRIVEGSELFGNTNKPDEKGEPVSNTNQLKMLATDGKMRLTDVLIPNKFCG